MDITTITQLLELGYPALITVAFAFLATKFMKHYDDEIAYLRQRIEALETKQKQLLERLG